MASNVWFFPAGNQTPFFLKQKQHFWVFLYLKKRLPFLERRLMFGSFLTFFFLFFFFFPHQFLFEICLVVCWNVSAEMKSLKLWEFYYLKANLIWYSLWKTVLKVILLYSSLCTITHNNKKLCQTMNKWLYCIYFYFSINIGLWVFSAAMPFGFTRNIPVVKY